MFDSVPYVALNSALDGLAARQTAIADNIANVNTPNYLAKVVKFEGELESAIARGNGAAGFTSHLSLEPTQLNGNNVNLDKETIANITNNLSYQTATQAISSTYRGIRTAMKTG